MKLHQTALAGGMLAAVLVSGCASTPPPPTDAMQAAEIAIKRAEEARVVDYASLELTSAREKLAASRNAAQSEDMRMARMLADEATFDAELATAKAEAAKARAANAEVVKSIDGMKQEIQRKTTGG